MEPDAWRFSKEELVYMPSHTESTIYLSIPKAKDIFTAWMKSYGWGISLSSPGNIAHQMLRRLGGINSLSILSHEDVLKLLRDMENGKTVSQEKFFAEIAKATNKKRFLNDPIKATEWLLDSGMIRLGAELQCPTCSQHSWYALNNLDYQLQCNNCFENFNAPVSSPKQIKWAYRTFGPFSLAGGAYGVYTVLLVLRFFSQLLRLPMTPMLSFEAKSKKNKYEIDLAFLLKETIHGDSDTKLLFVECKSSHDSFKKEDVERMSFISRQYPGSIIVFATLGRELSKAEKRLIVPLVNRGRKEWKTEHPYNPVLILTGAELLTDWSPPECWKEDGTSGNQFVEKYNRTFGKLLPLCDITQQKYLGLKPWNEWLEERRNLKKRRRVST